MPRATPVYGGDGPSTFYIGQINLARPFIDPRIEDRIAVRKSRGQLQIGHLVIGIIIFRQAPDDGPLRVDLLQARG